MDQYTLARAREYEERESKKIQEHERPAYHLTPMIGWMNDPNGFSWYGGEYHLFYQYHPYRTSWAAMHWGHAVSKDLVHWSYLPAVMAPDQPFDHLGCFSGTAETLPDGRHLLIYTGVHADEEGKESQYQCVAVGDGREYVKYAQNPVISDKTLPEGLSSYDFRDPKIWRTEDGKYRCILGACTKESHLGVILLYESEDGFKWNLLGELARNNGSYGRMWECPDFFALDGRYVLSVSPQEMLPEPYKYNNGNGTVCFIGDLDETGTKFLFDRDQPVDYGMDFYAPQTMTTPDGRKVMVAWMQNWDTTSLAGETDVKWNCQMTVVREISIRDGMLIQNPVRELNALRCAKVSHRGVAVDGALELPDVKGRVVDLELEISNGDENAPYKRFEILVAQNAQFKTMIRYDREGSILTVDRTYSGSRRNFSHQRQCRVADRNGKLKLRILVDRFSVEVFANDGEQAMTTTIRTDAQAEGISFRAEGSVLLNIDKYDLCKGE